MSNKNVNVNTTAYSPGRNLLISQLTSISGGHSAIRHLRTRVVQLCPTGARTLLCWRAKLLVRWIWH